MKSGGHENFILYWGLACKHKRELCGILSVTPLATIFYQVLPPLIISIIINWLIEYNETIHQSEILSAVLPWALLYFFTLFIGDVLLWRIVDHWYWKLEAKVSRDIALSVVERDSLIVKMSPNKLIDSCILFWDTTVYQLLPLCVGVLGSAIVLAFYTPILSVVLMISSLIYIAIMPLVNIRTIKLNQKTIAAEARRAEKLEKIAILKKNNSTAQRKDAMETINDAYNNLMKVKAAHRTQQLVAKSSITFISSIVLVVIIYALAANISIGTVFLVFIYTIHVTLQLFTFSNNSVRNYYNSFKTIQ